MVAQGKREREGEEDADVGPPRPPEGEQPGDEGDSDDDVGPPRPPPGAPAEDDSEDDVGPPRPPPGAQDGEDEEDADIGPMPPKKKKKRSLKFESVYLENLPCADMYEKSYMHRDTICHVAVASSDFFITASIDGHLKFWKKQAKGIEFVKHFRSHVGAVTGLAVSADGQHCATISNDKSAKIYDISTYDMMVMLRLDFQPGCVQWVYRPGVASEKALVAISDQHSGAIHIYDITSGDSTALRSLPNVHRHPVCQMRYNPQYNTVISGDTSGVIEYWCPDTLKSPEAPDVTFKYKLETDLYSLAKLKLAPRCLEVSPDGEQFVTVTDDRRIRVFRFQSGKIRRQYDESLKAANQQQKSEQEIYRLEDIDFGRRMAIERELDTAWREQAAAYPNAVFDESGNFLIYPTFLGIKIVNLYTNKLSRVLGKVENTERFLRVALFQGARQKDRRVRLATADLGGGGPVLDADPTILCCAHKKQRLYLFSRREPAEAMDEAAAAAGGRDVFNEKPPAEELIVANAEANATKAALSSSVTLHTSYGDVSLQLYPKECPRTVENFVTHCRNGYYDGIIFHRVIKGFMLQTGDPLGNGTGGQSIWGGEFEDEFNRSLRHDRPFTLSMANAGPNTNGSQFFITTVSTPWLDNKHTVFGRVKKGMDVCHQIENVKTDKNDKPYEDVKIVSVTIA
mmetsp:Transcript_7219/g.26559  ORF Transcript_7219/g.26559 Transcript_7219/m.26559 type:complete len:683 (-) Transcript_7219:1570-3618(-)